jgi:uroporphyrinogen-III synthase
VPAENTLANTRVLVTRPAHQADRLARLIISHGGEPIRFPTVEILDPRDRAALFALIDRLHEFDMAIFISANAVDKGTRSSRAE